jgi:hypothetical protein
MRVTHGIWTDLADRESDGLGVTLLWGEATGRVKVAVFDSRLDESFELHVAGADALAAFHHPFAYASTGVACRGRGSLRSTDIQLQS